MRYSIKDAGLDLASTGKIVFTKRKDINENPQRNVCCGRYGGRERGTGILAALVDENITKRAFNKKQVFF